MKNYPPAYPHESIQEIFSNIFMVTGDNVEKILGLTITFQRNMIIVKEGDELTLINTMRLTDKGLQELDQLGNVKNVVSIGCRHGKDDQFYIDRYQAKTWVIDGMKHRGVKQPDVALSAKSEQPFSHCSTTILEFKKNKEGLLVINQEGGILIACDILIAPFTKDPGCNLLAKLIFRAAGMWSKLVSGHVVVPKTIVLDASIVRSDLDPVANLTYQHLLSSHGDPVLNNAKALVDQGIKESF